MHQRYRSPCSEVGIRTLIYIPIIHSRADLGVFGEQVRRATLLKQGVSALRRKENLIERHWEQIEKAIASRGLFFPKVRLYQDGLPVCGREVEIVQELAKGGSRNCQLLLRLMGQGAALMGTESPELVVQEYELHKTILNEESAGRTPAARARRQTRSDALIRQRDQYIAGRIQESLGEGETGILFLGAFHSLGQFLPPDIRLQYPADRPLDRGGR